MDARHEMSVEHARLLSGAGGYATMDNSATGHPNSQQLRPPYGELCRPPGSDASTLSAAYHSRYLASMPLSTGSTFPFLGGMFTGTLPGPPSPFRAPSTPGVNNMRFWPPTPPPDGYGRYSMNTSLFPLFGAPSPDSGAYLSQGLVSRIGSTTHLSPVIDHKEHSFFTHGIGLGSPLTPTSHVTSPSPFPHLIPSLERHPAYIGHMTLGSKELEECYNEEEVRLLKSHMDCLMNQDMPPSRQERLKSKGEGKHCCEKVSTDDCCKLSNTKTHGSSKMDGKGHHQPTNKVHPCKIEVSHSPALKPDMLSPPIESPKPERASPCRNLKKSAVGPVQPSSVTNHNGSLETRCSQCSASMKDVVVGSKASGGSVVSTAIVTPNTESFVSKNCSSSTVAMFSMTYSDSRCSPVSINHSRVAAEHVENKHNNQKSPRTSPVITITDAGDRPSDSTHYKPRSAPEIIPTKSCNVPPVPFKHVTAAVIPTAPKQAVHREIHPETNCLSIQDLTKETPSTAVSEANNFNSDNHNVKLETSDTSGHSDKTASSLNQSSSPVCNAAALKSQNKNLSTSCKVKDMIRHASSAKQSTGEKLPEASPSKNTESDGCSRGLLPNSPSKSVPFNVLPSSVGPTNLCKSPCQTTKSSSPIMKAEMVGSRQDCEFSQKSTSWTKATVMPFSWQNNSGHDDQAINLTVSKKPVKPEPNEALNQHQDTRHLSVKVSSESMLTNTEVIGVCHPTPSPVAVNKVKGTPAVSSISNFSAISVLNQPVEQSTEVHILHRSSKSSFPIVNRNATPPVPLKSTISHVTANTSIHRSVKAERLTSKRGKLGDADKLNHSRAALATLAPKLSKGMGFGKDVQTSHTLSASSSVSSTSIVFPATVNPCIPVGIAIAQQRQDTSANMGKAQQSVPSSVSNVITPNQHLATSRVAADLQAQEILAEQKNQDLSCSNNPTPVDTNLLVTQGPTIVSRQWESEALTRTAMPSASWLTHGSMVAPAVWLGQNAYTAAPTTNTVPSIAMNPLEPSPISLPPGGYQLARDISGHLLLIPTANIELMDRPSVWPSFNTSAGNLPIQQLVTQQQHTQFEQVLPHAETLKTEAVDNCNLDISSQTKAEDKVEDIGGQVPSVPLASGQTYAFTTFPTQCDPSSFSYVLQSSTVMHLAHTQTASSIAPDSGRRSQGTSPLHCATPSPVPCSVQVTEDEEESDAEAAEVPAGQGLPRGRSVTTAIQVDMDSQTNSEEDEEEPKIEIGKLEESKVEMSDSANQTESVASESPKSDRENEAEDIILNEQTNHQSTSLIHAKEDQLPLVLAEPVVESETVVSIGIKEDIVHSEPGMEIVTSETELAPSLPVESKPVMDFIDHHGLNLLVDSIEEFASREQGETQKDPDVPLQVTTGFSPVTAEIKESEFKDKLAIAPVEDHRNAIEKFNPSKYKTIDPSCTDGLGLLCALAEQRFFEEALNIDENKSKLHQKELQDSTSSVEDPKPKIDVSSSVREQSNSNDSFLSSCSSSQDYEEVSELDMRARLTELQKKYREKQRELELLKNQREREGSDDDDYISNSPKPPRTSTPIKNYSSHPKSAPTFREHLLKNSISKPWPKKQKRLESETEKTNSKMIKKAKAASKREREYTQKEEEHGKIPSITLVHETSASISSNDSNASSGFSSESRVKKTNRMQNYNAENSSESVSCTSKDESCSQDQDYDKNDKTKTPVFDETAWFVRRSERIFLSDARSIPSSTPDKNAKKSSSNSSQKVAGDVSQKEKKESVKSLKLTKCPDDSETRKRRKRGRNKLHISKQYISSESGDSSSSDNEESENETSDGASSTSENMPLSTLVEQTTNKTPTERKKRHSVDSACSDISSGQSEDIPLSVLLNGQKDESLPELKSCILQSAELHENARLLVLDEGLFYAGNITKSGEPDVYGILIDGDRAARPHLFSKEEILNAAVLEVKPVDKRQLPEGTRICAFWSQQYRCLYPGTVTKASSPMPDSSMLYVEFDDGDSGRIPINDIRMLPPDFPIVSMEPNPFMILGKRRSRAQSQNSCGTNDAKSGNESSQGSEKDKSELKKQKSAEKLNRKSVNPDGKNKDSLKRKRSPSASNRSRSSSSHGRSETKISRSEGGEEDKSKKSMTKSDDAKPKDDKSLTDPKPKKHKKHKEDHHKHHHHHHHKHHHKKHKTDKHDRRSSNDSVISSNTSISCDSPTSVSSRVSNPEQELFVLENSKSDLTVKIKKSPSPHTNPEDAAALAAAVEKKTTSRPDSPNESVGEPVKKKTKKAKLQDSQNKPAKRKERVPSIEKSKIAAFLPVRQLWRWSGKSFRKPGAKGKAKKEFYRAIQRGKETIRVGDCAVFLSTGRPHLPYIGRIETMWESWGGKMDVKVKWFYHPEETKSGKKLSQLKGALFQSPHFDENDVQTISHKCEVLAWDEYQQKKHPENKYGSLFDNNDTYFLAGTYDPILGTLILEPGVPANPPSNALDL